MKVLKASAGSGKTYRLSKAYIDLLLSSSDPKAYRHILAVTFTNKATDEMKQRILDELYRKSAGDERAKRLLVAMLHDYSAFSVSTIDHFFQHTIKAFSRELGHFADYQIELERTNLIHEAVDSVIDSLTADDRVLLDWIALNLTSTIENGGRIDLGSMLYPYAENLKSEQFRKVADAAGLNGDRAFSVEHLLKVQDICATLTYDFEEALIKTGLPKVSHDSRFENKGLKRELAKNPRAQAIIDEGLDAYGTAYIISSNLFALAFAREFSEAFDALTREKNVMCLDESNALLRDIITGSDAPFIYEKVGVRYEHFMLDEFQDTSNIQWDNFLPLLRESESKGGSNLIVGDVKQSIYRWRDSDWTLLEKQVPAAFPSADIEALDGNWRSAGEVVRFNNAFFKFAASKLGYSELYSDVAQKVMRSTEAGEGMVEVLYTQDQLAGILESVKAVLDAGGRPGDIAVIVRTNTDGAEVVSYLLSNGIDVVSDDSFKFSSSAVVTRLIGLLSAYGNPSDKIGEYLASECRVEYPDNCNSLVDFCEAMVRELKKSMGGAFAGELLFVQAFMDEVRGWSDKYGNDIGRFLQHWNEKDRSISSPQSGDSVRVITIHKSKGLQFEHVIFPFAESVTLFKRNKRWCRLDAPAHRLPEELSGVYLVEHNTKNLDSHFRSDIEEEMRMQAIDNLNVFYVALTRARKSMCIISEPVGSKFRKTKPEKREYKRLSDLLFEFIGDNDARCYGSPYDFSTLERGQGGSMSFEAGYPSIPIGGRLSPSADAMDFFSDDDLQLVGTKASARLRGIVLHDILSSVRGPSGLRGAVERAAAAGSLDPEEAKSAYALLSARLAAHPAWFPETGAEVLNEQSIFDAYGNEHRPDRVLLEGDRARIIDFKFGHKDERYLRQIGRYAKLYTQLGYKVTEAAIWYVETDEIQSLYDEENN